MPGENPNKPHTAYVGGKKTGDRGESQRHQRRRRGFFAPPHKLKYGLAPASCDKPVRFLSGTLQSGSTFALAMTAGIGGLAVLTASTLPVSAAETSNSLSALGGSLLQDRSSIFLLAIFSGAISFSFLAVFWMIRERARISEENNRLRKSFSGVRADHDRLAALLEVDDFCIIVWNDDQNSAQVLGTLNKMGKNSSGVSCQVPDQADEFLAFGKWLTPGSAIEIESSIRHLRKDGQQFTTELAAKDGSALEAQGRVSGGQAFVRFVMLDGARESLARVSRENKQLMDRLGVIEKLFETLPTPLWIRSRDGALAYTNPAYAAAVDAEDCDDAVRNNKDLFDSKERAILSANLGKNGSSIEQLPVVVAGDRKIMETIAISDEHGSAGLAIDRSDVEAVRATLKHAIASHQQTFDHLNSAVAIFDAKQKLQFHNSSFQQMWGLSSSDLEGNPSNGDLLETLRSQSCLPEMPDWKKWKSQQLESYHATETRAENWHLPDGRTLRVIVNPQNQGGTSWVFENVTEELALKSNYNSLMRVQGETLDHLNEAVAVFGSDGKVRLTNPAFLSLWKFNCQEAVEGHHIRKVTEQVSVLLQDRSGWDTICLGVTGVDDDRNDLAGRLELHDGTVLDYHLVYLPEGQSMLTLADVTAAVNIERALQDRNDALEESDALKTRFIQNVSYELRAPLTSISGFAEILDSGVPGKLNAKQSEYLDYITRSSDVLKALIDDILDLASIDAGAMQLEQEKVDLDAVIDESIAALSEKMERFQISTKVDVTESTKGFVADSSRVRQVVYNLLSNAVAVSPDGGLITIRAGRDGDQVKLSIADQGPGIPPESRETIFTRFESGLGGGRRRGAGLGLSIVKSFVELHGGSITIDADVPKGACFICSFPFQPVSNLQAAE